MDSGGNFDAGDLDAGDLDAGNSDAGSDDAGDMDVDAGPPTLVASESHHDFGTLIRSTSDDATVTITNPGNTSGALSLVLEGQSGYSLTADSCTGVSVGPIGSCQFTVGVTTSLLGERTATVTIAGTPGGTIDVTFVAEFVEPAMLSSDPPLHDFMLVAVGAMATRTVRVSNSGGAASDPLVPMLTGDPQLTLVNDGCTGTSVAPSSFCELTVQFAPTMAGAEFAAELSFGPSSGIPIGHFFGEGQ